MIRKAEIQDAEALAQCHREAVLAIESKFYNKAQIEAWIAGTIPSKYFDAINKGEIFVIEQSGCLGAFGWVKKSPAEIRALYVSPSCQSRGLGSDLLTFLEEKLREIGVTEVMLGASLNAQTFYEKHGYLSGATSTIEMSGISSPLILMTKKLN